MRFPSPLVVALLVLACADRAWADGPTTSDHEAAVAEFGAGRALFEAGDCKGAIPRFVASLKREQSVGARFNLAECSAREGRTAEAWNHYKAAEQLAIRKGDNPRGELAHSAAVVLDRSVTKIRLVIPSDVSSLTLKIDGAPIDVTDHWLLSTGYALEPRIAHTLSAEASGKPAWTRSNVRGDPGVEIPAMVVDFGKPKEAIVPRQKSSPLKAASYVIGGTGLAALAAGGVVAFLASSSKSTAQSECTEGSSIFSYPAQCNPARRSDVNEANGRATTQASIATIGIISGAALVSAAVILFFTARSKSSVTGFAATPPSVSSSGPNLLSTSF